MPLFWRASVTFGCSSSGIGACWPGRGWTLLCVTSRSSSRPACSSSSHGSMSRMTAIACQPRRVLRAAYVDMDGTLLGRRASLFHDADGAFTMLGARVLEACARASVELVPYSGRRQSTLLHNAVMLGLRSCISRRVRVVLDGEVVSLVERTTKQRANALLLARVPARDVRPMEPRARVVAALAGRRSGVGGGGRMLIEEGFGAWRLVDNGLMHGVRVAGLPPDAARGLEGPRRRAPHAARGTWRRRSSRSGTRWRTSARPRSSARSARGEREPEVHSAARGVAKCGSPRSEQRRRLRAVITELAERR